MTRNFVKIRRRLLTQLIWLLRLVFVTVKESPMKMRTVLAIITGTLVWGASAAQAQITVNLVPGNFTYQFADPTTGAAITSMTITQGSTKSVAVYLVQTAGTPPNL